MQNFMLLKLRNDMQISYHSTSQTNLEFLCSSDELRQARPNLLEI